MDRLKLDEVDLSRCIRKLRDIYISYCLESVSSHAPGLRVSSASSLRALNYIKLNVSVSMGLEAYGNSYAILD